MAHLMVALLLVCGVASQTALAEQDSHLRAMSDDIETLEKTLASIESTKKIDRPGTEIEKAMDVYAKDSHAAFDVAWKDAQTFARSKGTKGSMAPLAEFEKVAVEHRDRWSKIVDRIAAIGPLIQTGEILLTKKAVRSLNQKERIELRHILTPEAEKLYRQQVPELFARNAQPIEEETASSGSLPAADESAPASSSMCSVASLRDAVAWLLSPSEAEAALAVGCLAACPASAGSACFACLLASGATAVATWNNYQSCLRGCGRCRWYRPWACVCRAGCTILWVAVIG